MPYEQLQALCSGWCNADLFLYNQGKFFIPVLEYSIFGGGEEEDKKQINDSNPPVSESVTFSWDEFLYIMLSIDFVGKQWIGISASGTLISEIKQDLDWKTESLNEITKAD